MITKNRVYPFCVGNMAIINNKANKDGPTPTHLLDAAAKEIGLWIFHWQWGKHKKICLCFKMAMMDC